MLFGCLLLYLYMLLCHLDVSRMYSMPSVCHSHLLVCRPYVTPIYSHAIRVSLVWTRVSLVSTRMSPVCHSYVLVCHPFATRLWFYHESLITIKLTIQPLKLKKS